MDRLSDFLSRRGRKGEGEKERPIGRRLSIEFEKRWVRVVRVVRVTREEEGETRGEGERGTSVPSLLFL